MEMMMTMMKMKQKKKKKKMQEEGEEDQMARSMNERLMHQRSQSMRLDRHISPGLSSCAQMKQKDWRWEARSEAAERMNHGSQQQQQQRGEVMAMMDPRSGGDGDGDGDGRAAAVSAAGIKNGYPVEQRQRSSVLRSMSMRAAGARSASDPAMGYIVLGCAICGAAPLLGPPVVAAAAAMAPPLRTGCGHCTCRCGHQEHSHGVLLPAEEAAMAAEAPPPPSSSSSSSSEKAAKSGVKKKKKKAGGSPSGGGGRLLGAFCRRMLGQLAFRSKHHQQKNLP